MCVQQEPVQTRWEGGAERNVLKLGWRWQGASGAALPGPAASSMATAQACVGSGAQAGQASRWLRGPLPHTSQDQS